jgi:hypothetical protein
VWRTPLTTRVILNSRIASFYTRGSNDPNGGGTEDEGGVGERRTSDVFVKTTRRVERDAEFFCKLWDQVPVCGWVGVPFVSSA